MPKVTHTFAVFGGREKEEDAETDAGVPHAVHDPVRTLSGEERVATRTNQRNHTARNQVEEVATLARVQLPARVTTPNLEGV